MRNIVLPLDREEADDAFSIFYTAAFAGVGPKTVAESRKLGKLQDALEDLSYDEPTKNPQTGAPDTKRVISSELKTIKMEDAHWDTLKQRIFGAEIGWTAGMSRKLISAYEILDGAEE